ncbi:peptide chain release factor N(5)-glutamine methyltransferase [Kallotenue papyrolyticum]|uniref:peptide chain release factor N(5)-glutamine methyltransferase n=1 Tax=Kallotenue papyrolyticum TaxID=1325125 RepID=UPI000478576C|nr:peptide chain release factor N(5)-glutamine methyltransferase [Kallotenue papyrolyticum]
MDTVESALRSATRRLAPVSPTPGLDAQVLLAHVLGVSRARLLSDSQRTLTAAQQAAYQALIARRAALEPVAYLIGRKEFFGRDFSVDRRVLIPRPETELIVELALQHARRCGLPARVADIGTGSGCLAITLALEFPQARVFAVDCSEAALEVARLNAERHGVAGRVTFLLGDALAPLPQPVDLIVANPPYTVLAEVEEGVRRWEPHLALDGGAQQGFAEPARWLAQAPSRLCPGGLLLMEIAAWQGAQALAAARAAFPTAETRLYQDLAGHDRVLLVRAAAPT